MRAVLLLCSLICIVFVAYSDCARGESVVAENGLIGVPGDVVVCDHSVDKYTPLSRCDHIENVLSQGNEAKGSGEVFKSGGHNVNAGRDDSLFCLAVIYRRGWQGRQIGKRVFCITRYIGSRNASLNIQSRRPSVVGVNDIPSKGLIYLDLWRFGLNPNNGGLILNKVFSSIVDGDLSQASLGRSQSSVDKKQTRRYFRPEKLSLVVGCAICLGGFVRLLKVLN